MLKISDKQLAEIVEQEWQRLRQRIEQQWPSLSRQLYPDLRPLHPEDARKRIKAALQSCHQWDVDDEQTAIALTINILSAATLRLPYTFIEDMTRYFLASAARDEATDEQADTSQAQEWIRWTLLEQYRFNPQRATRLRLQLGGRVS